MEKIETWIWDRYWHFDRLASCFDFEGSNYPDDFKREWQAFFNTLPVAAKILDLCTGNGAAARMAAEFSKNNSKNFQITGVDLAEIDPKKFAKPTPGQETIEFIGGVQAEELPFSDNTFDAVISQYGFEYTDHAKTISELARVLKAGGKGKFICHDFESVQTKNAFLELGLLDQVLNQIALFPTALEATEAVWRAEKEGAENAKAEILMKQFQDKMNHTARLARSNPEVTSIVHSLGLLKHTFEVRSHFPLEVLLGKIEDAYLEAQAHSGRLEALYEAALSPEKTRNLKQALEKQGFSGILAQPFELEERNRNVGTKLSFDFLA